MKKLIMIFIFFCLTTGLTQASQMKLVGTALAEFSIFKIDIYQISYYKGDSGAEQIVLDYKTNVKRKYSIMGWEEGLKHVLKLKPEYKNQYNWILAQVVDLKKGDQYIIRKENNVVSMLKNNELIGKKEDPIIASLIFEPWLGSVPVDKEIKRKLLNIRL